ncbi:hypothetical protein [Campylobacter concisus]|uniref:hypothetical protein n=1 Tax=Campylobacter concisus TaxID=199 RepID=UPI000CD80BB4|nr:hypothetical protein [Campylobacter concisus]
MNQNKTITIAYNKLKKGEQLNTKLYWELVAIGLHPCQLKEAIAQGISLKKLLRPNTDALDAPTRVYERDVKRLLNNQSYMRQSNYIRSLDRLLQAI